MPVKPFDLEDLRSIMASQPDEEIDALSDSDWVANVDASELINILHRGTSDLKAQVAENTASPPVALSHLAKDDQGGLVVRRKLAENPSTPPEALTGLARSKDFIIRGEVAANPSTPAKILAHLAKDSDTTVRMELTKNPSLPSELWISLAKDSHLFVRQWVVDHFDPTRTPSVANELFTLLAGDPEDLVRMRLAKNPKTPPEILTRLATNESSADLVRQAVAENPSTPPDVLAELAKVRGDGGFIAGALSRNPSASHIKTAGCFPASTLILTPSGSRSIADLKRGDVVLSMGHQGRLVETTITAVTAYKPTPVMNVSLENQTNVRTTSHHRLGTTEGWRMVKHLKPGDTLIRPNDEKVRIASITLEAIEPVFNLYTTQPHNFVADGVLAHSFTVLPTLRALLHRLFVDPFVPKRKKGPAPSVTVYENVATPFPGAMQMPGTIQSNFEH